MKSGVIFSIIFLALISACKTPVEHEVTSLNEISQVVFYTSLKDSIPEKTYRDLNVNPTGLKVIGLTGADVRYFEYQSDAERVIRALSNSPFDMDYNTSDTICREISKEELSRSLNYSRSADDDYTSNFKNYDAERFEAYECIKPPLVHHILINRSSGQVFHRIERMS
jgi:hypothetical protein